MENRQIETRITTIDSNINKLFSLLTSVQDKLKQLEKDIKSYKDLNKNNS